MAFDAFVLSSVCQELEEQLLNAKIGKIHQPNKHSLILRYHNRQKKGRLLISAHPQNGRIHLTESNEENPLNPPLFCMVLRKYLENSRLIAIKQQGMERIVHFDFLIRNDLGDDDHCTMIVEIMGKHSNIILVNKDMVIIDGIRRYSHLLSRYREVLPGRDYLAPPPQEKYDYSLLDEEKLAQILFALPLNWQLKKALSATVYGLSPLLLEETICQSGLDPHLTLEELGEYEIRQLLNTVKSIMERFDLKNFQPTLLGGDQPRDIAAFPLSLWQDEDCRSLDSPSQALDHLYIFKENSNLFSSRQRELLKLVNAHQQRLSKKIDLQKDDLIQADKGDFYKEAGDLLSANLYHLQKGMEKTCLESFYEIGKTIEIPLKPHLTPEENMRNYFRLYSKAKNAHSLIEKQLLLNEEELEYIASVAQALEEAINEEDLQEIKEELIQSGYLKDHHKKGKKTSANKPLEPLSFTSSDGFLILVGRNNKQNDKLTLKTAAKNDIWLHTQKIPGSHVIIRCQGQEVPETTLLEAAALAAYHSKAKNSPKVPVDYTTVDQVKKPNGAKPGMVIYFQQRTIYAEPQASLDK